MKGKYSRFSILLGAMLLLTNCIYEKMTHFTDDDLEWISGQTKGETVFFASNFGHTDTLIITDKYVYDTHNPLYIRGRRIFDTHEAYASYQFIIKKDDKRFRDKIIGHVSITKLEGNDELAFSSDFDKRFSVTNYHIEELDSLDNLDKLMNIDSIKSNYLVFDDTNSKYSIYKQNMENKIVKYAVHKNYGLVYYMLENGEEFIRKFY